MPIGSGPRAARGDNGRQNSPNDQHHSAFDAVGQGFFALYADDDDDDDDHPPPQRNALKPTNPPDPTIYDRGDQRPPLQPPQQAHTQPSPAPRRDYDHQRPPLQGRAAMPNMEHPVPRAPPPTFMKSPAPRPQPPPMSPHPLQLPPVPIAPAFAKPKNSPRMSLIKFAENSILRGNGEETLLSKSTPKGAEFWRRFSFVVKEEPTKQRSSWLVKNHSGSSRMRGCIWIITLILLIVLGGLGTTVWWLTRGSPTIQPKTLGGSANGGIETTTTVRTASSSSSSPLHTVSGDLPPSTTPIPTMGMSTTLAAARRSANPFPVPTNLTHRRRSQQRVVFH